jgi:hypothetical protein
VPNTFAAASLTSTAQVQAILSAGHRAVGNNVTSESPLRIELIFAMAKEKKLRPP